MVAPQERTGSRPVPMVPLIGALLIGAALAGGIGWRLNVQSIDHQIRGKRTALKKLMLNREIPPNEEVQAYLATRQRALEQQYAHWREVVAVPPVSGTAASDPQLFFQEQFHEVQRTLERLAVARSAPVPELLGFPKELPPSDMVPRLLAQLSLIEALAEVLYEQGVVEIDAFKIEDPQTVTTEEDNAPFLLRTPVRVRATATLSQFAKSLAAIDRARPLVDLRALKTVPQGAAGDHLDVEFVLARYVVAAGVAPAANAGEAVDASPEDDAASTRRRRAPARREPRVRRP